MCDHCIKIVLKHLTFVTLTDIVTTTMTISTSLVFYLYMDIWKIKWMNEWNDNGKSLTVQGRNGGGQILEHALPSV